MKVRVHHFKRLSEGHLKCGRFTFEDQTSGMFQLKRAFIALLNWLRVLLNTGERAASKARLSFVYSHCCKPCVNVCVEMKAGLQTVSIRESAKPQHTSNYSDHSLGLCMATEGWRCERFLSGMVFLTRI